MKYRCKRDRFLILADMFCSLTMMDILLQFFPGYKTAKPRKYSKQTHQICTFCVWRKRYLCGLRWFLIPRNSDVSLVSLLLGLYEQYRSALLVSIPWDTRSKHKQLYAFWIHSRECVLQVFKPIEWATAKKNSACFGWIHLKMHWAETTINRPIARYNLHSSLSRKQ